MGTMPGTRKGTDERNIEKLFGSNMKETGNRGLIPVNMRLPVVLALVVNMIAYYGTRLVTKNFYHYDLTGGIDEKIPVIPWTILIYWGCYLYWAVNYVIGSRQEPQKAYRFFAADFLAKIVCLVIFLVFPTTNVRPVLTQDGFFTELMRTLYAVDAADNLFPSIHCLTSWFCFIAVRNNERICRLYRWISLIITILICISTLTTKQHVIVDAAGGIFLAEGCYGLAEKSNFDVRYRKWVGKIERIIGKTN